MRNFILQRAKRCFITALIVALLLGVTPVYALSHESDQYITFEEYSAAIEREYSKYGIEGGVYEPEGEFLCTYETLQSDLAIVKGFCEAYVDRQPMPIMSNPEFNPSITPMSMIGRVTMTHIYRYTDLSLPVIPLSCEIKTTVDIDVDYQRSYIVCVYTPKLEIIAATGFDDWIEYVSHHTMIDQDKKRVSMYITCKVKQELSLGVVTSWAKVDLNYTAVFNNVPC